MLYKNGTNKKMNLLLKIKMLQEEEKEKKNRIVSSAIQSIYLSITTTTIKQCSDVGSHITDMSDHTHKFLEKTHY